MRALVLTALLAAAPALAQQAPAATAPQQPAAQPDDAGGFGGSEAPPAAQDQANLDTNQNQKIQQLSKQVAELQAQLRAVTGAVNTNAQATQSAQEQAAQANAQLDQEAQAKATAQNDRGARIDGLAQAGQVLADATSLVIGGRDEATDALSSAQQMLLEMADNAQSLGAGQEASAERSAADLVGTANEQYQGRNAYYAQASLGQALHLLDQARALAAAQKTAR
jgi:outer membrane murein-binding lipoprotein Lpp